MPKYKAIIWGCGGCYNLFSGAIWRLVDQGKMSILGFTGNDTIYRSIDGIGFIPLNEMHNIDYDFMIIAVADHNRADVYHQAELLGIERGKLIRADVFSLPYFDLQRYMKLRERPVSIISQTCMGGFLYHRMDLKFMSPTINMFFEPTDFIELCLNLKDLLCEAPVFAKYVWNYKQDFSYPVMKLGGRVEMHFNHVRTVEEALEKWDARCKLVNYDNVLVMMKAEKTELLEQYESIPFKKVCFSSFISDMADVYYLPIEGKEQYGEYADKPVWGIYGGIVIKAMKGDIPAIDPLSLLLGDRDFIRCKYES